MLSSASSEHAAQLHSGLELLARSGAIALEFMEAPAPDWVCGPPRLSRNRSVVQLLVNGRRVLYDLDDSDNLPTQGLAWADICFKRMLLPSDETAVVRPYGLNYPVSVDETAAPRTWRDLPSTRALRPQSAPGSGVVCITRLWSPADGRSDEDREWRERINAYRVDLVTRLREDLGPDFVGGIITDEFSSHHSPAAGLLLDETLTLKDVYLARVARSAIVVTTSGLHRSIGWRFGEAMSLGRAVVSETFECSVPGTGEGMPPWRTFGATEEALNVVAGLRADPRGVRALQARGRQYYAQWLRPEALVARTLVQALNHPADE